MVAKSTYELTVIIRHDMADNDADKLVDSFGDIVKSEGGKVIKKEYWGLRTFAYKINKAKKGHYFFVGYEGPNTLVAELERKARISEDVVRVMHVKTDSISKDQSAILTNKEAA